MKCTSRVKAVLGRILIAGILVTLSPSALSPQDTAPPGQERQAAVNDSLERAIRAFLASQGVPGAAVAVVRGDSVVFAKGFGVGSIETNQPVTPEMLFQVGSSSKMFAAALVLSLAVEHAVDLDAPVRTYVTRLNVRVANSTLRQLLSHSSGLRDMPGESGAQDESAMAAFVHAWDARMQILPATIAFSYSNAGYTLAGVAAEAVARRPFGDLMSERIFQPLGMARSTYRPLLALTHPTATGHRGAAKSGEVIVVRPYANDTRFWPAGYAYTNVVDFARFVAALMNGGVVAGRQAVPATAVALMLTPQIQVPNIFANTRYGFGLFLGPYRGRASAWHDGQMPGFGSVVRIVPESRLGVIVMMNRENVRPDRIVDAAFDAFGLGDAAASAPPSVIGSLPMSTAEMSSYVGKYSNRADIEIVMRDGALYRRGLGPEQRIYKIGEHRFTVDSTMRNRVVEFTIMPETSKVPAYVHAFLWAYAREKRK